MKSHISEKCQNCPKKIALELSIEESRKIIELSNDIKSQYEQFEIETMAEGFGKATTLLLNEALASKDNQYIQLAEVYTKPVVEVLNRYMAGLPVSAKDFVEAATLGALDARNAGMVQTTEIQGMIDALGQFYKFNDVTIALKNEIADASIDLQENIESKEKQITDLQKNCPGPKKSILRLGKYTCKSPNK